MGVWKDTVDRDGVGSVCLLNRYYAVSDPVAVTRSPDGSFVVVK